MPADYLIENLAIQNGETPIFLSAQPLVGEIAEDEVNDNYQVSVNLRTMTWGDNMVHVRFQLLTETIGNADAEGSTKADALRELMAGFDELTAYLERVARVTRNGVRIPFKDVPMDFVSEVMEAINKAQRRNSNSKN